MKTTTTRGQLTLDTSAIDIHFYFPILRLIYCLFVFNTPIGLKTQLLSVLFPCQKERSKIIRCSARPPQLQ